MEGLKSDFLTHLIRHVKGARMKNAKRLRDLCFLLFDASLYDSEPDPIVTPL